MQKRKIHQKNKFLQLFGLIITSILTIKTYPLAKPSLVNSLEKAAIISALGTNPQDAVYIIKEKILSKNEDEIENENYENKVIYAQNNEISEKNEIETESEITEENIQTSTQISEEISEEIPTEYRAEIIEENMSGTAKTGVPEYKKTLIKNNTKLSDEEVVKTAEEELSLEISTKNPQVLIYHTHATESFEKYDSKFYDTRNTWRSTNPEENMIAVGNEIEKAIEAWGVEVIHDTSLHDYPSYNGSYQRSAETIAKYLEEYPTIKVLLDVHRDAVQRETILVKPVTTINGIKTAQLMIVTGCDSEGELNIPNWKNNFQFGVRIQNEIEEKYPTLCRPLFLTSGKYNQNLGKASILLEVGSHGNTLEEAKNCGKMTGDAIGSYLSKLIEN